MRTLAAGGGGAEGVAVCVGVRLTDLRGRHLALCFFAHAGGAWRSLRAPDWLRDPGRLKQIPDCQVEEVAPFVFSSFKKWDRKRREGPPG